MVHWRLFIVKQEKCRQKSSISWREKLVENFHFIKLSKLLKVKGEWPFDWWTKDLFPVVTGKNQLNKRNLNRIWFRQM